MLKAAERLLAIRSASRGRLEGKMCLSGSDKGYHVKLAAFDGAITGSSVGAEQEPVDSEALATRRAGWPKP